MSDEAFLNLVLHTLEKEGVISLSHKNGITNEILVELKRNLQVVKNKAINEHIVALFGVK